MESFASPPERFLSTGRVFLAEPDEEPVRTAEVERAWSHDGQVVLKLAGVDDRDAADALKNFEVLIPLSERPALPEGEYYHSDLLGCQVVETNGEPIGEVRDVVDYGAGPLLVLEDRGKELMIPFVKGIWTEVDLAARRITVALPEGLRDL